MAKKDAVATVEIVLEVLQPFTARAGSFTVGQRIAPEEYDALTFPGSRRERIANGFLRYVDKADP